MLSAIGLALDVVGAVTLDSALFFRVQTLSLWGSRPPDPRDVRDQRPPAGGRSWSRVTRRTSRR